VINGVRLGLGVALMARSRAKPPTGIGFLVIQAYSVFNMPQIRALSSVQIAIAPTRSSGASAA
jgi:ABC-type nitrate/sulfonate/bicarbonate transport system permease component